MDNSLNFIEQMETELQFDENINYNYAPEKEIEAEVIDEQDLNHETQEEQNLEREISSMRYQEVDAFIRHEIKEMIFKEGRGKVSLAVLREKKDILLDQIKNLRDLIDENDKENDQINNKLQMENDELQLLQRQVLNGGTIVKKLEEFMNSIQDRHRELRTREHQFTKKLEDHKKKCLNLNNDWLKRKSDWDSKIVAKKSLNDDTDDLDQLRKEGRLLKAQLLEKRERLETLKSRCEESEAKKRKLNSLKEKKEGLEDTLRNLNLKKQELKSLKDQNEKETKERSKMVELVLEEKGNKLRNLLQRAVELEEKCKEKSEEYDGLVSALVSEEERKDQLTRQVTHRFTSLEELRREREEKIKKWNEKARTAEEKLKESGDNLTAIIKENDELNRILRALREEFVAKMEEKDEKFQQKLEVERKLNRMKTLDEKIVKNQKVVDELAQKIEKLRTDQRLQDLEKEKAYLTSTSNYLTEKNENVKKEVDDLKIQAKNLKETRDKLITEKQEFRDSLLKELEELKDFADTEEPLKQAGILKSPLPHKKFPVSPKKVQFEGVSSYESSSSGEKTGDITQETFVGKSFDDIIAEINAGTFKQPLKAARRRKIDL